MRAVQAPDHDLSLPARGGDACLVPPGPAELLRLVGRHLLLPHAPRPAGARLDGASWKPGVSVVASYGIDFEDGGERRVQLQRFAGEEAARLADRLVVDERLEAQCDRLRPWWLDPEHRLVAWVYPADPALPGARRLLDLRRTARLLNESGALDGRSVRKRKTRVHLSSYRPGRRAVHVLEVSLRRGDRVEGEERLAARVLPPGRAVLAIAARRTLAGGEDEGASTQPELLLTEARTGVLIERWVHGVASPREDFSRAVAAGRALGALHSARMRRRIPPRRSGRLEELLPLLRVAATGHPALPALPALAQAGTTWVHGAFHPDQVVLDPESGRGRLLGFDRLAQDDPARDLASWVADRLHLAPELELRDAAGELLEGYYAGGGARLESGRLAVRVAEELVRRAASGIRRLERDAVRRAERSLVRARDLVPRSPLVA